MSLWRCMRDSGPFKSGDFLEDDPDDGSVQKVKVWEEGGRLHSGAFVGIAVPLSSVRKDLLLILKKGRDQTGQTRLT